MKITGLLAPFLLALIAAIGNALVTLGQKKAGAFQNPFFFGSFSLLIAAIILFSISFLYPTKGLQQYFAINLKWFVITGFGLVMLNIFLYFLYRNHGASYYTLYAILAIITTSILLSVFVFGEKMNMYYYISFVFAALTIFMFMKGKMNNL
ncbi:MAG: DMT family transporter [Bacteroidetes bacterium]|nr:DMT family transporter [Bacteroidota bacterium]